MRRRLALRREVLAELESADMYVVAGGAPPTRYQCELPSDTCFSCLTYISCNPLACVIRHTVVNCIVVDTAPC